MEKVLKILLMLLVVAAVVFAAGCAGNTKSNVTQPSEQVTPNTQVSNESVTQSEVTSSVPAETNVTENSEIDTNETAGNETNMSAATVSTSQDNTAGHVSLTAMKRAKIRANLGVNNTTV
jgi:inhibitor of cysteine peptidase